MSDFIKKEDYWAIYIGFFVLLVGTILFFLNSPQDLETKYSNEESLDLSFLQNSKQVKIGEIIDEETDELLEGDHIKHVGTFRMNVVLLSTHHQTTKKKKGRPKPINAIPTSTEDEEEIVATVKVVVEGQ